MPSCIVGAGGFAKCICDALWCNGDRDIVFLSRDVTSSSTLFGFPVLNEVDLFSCNHALPVFVGIGDESIRERYVTKVREQWRHLYFPPLIHPGAVVDQSARVNEGVIVLAGAAIGSKAIARRFSAVCTGARICDNVELNEFATAGPASTVARGTVIGKRAFIGLRAEIAPNLNVGADSVIGAQAIVMQDVPQCAIVIGRPAFVRRHRQPGLRPF